MADLKISQLPAGTANASAVVPATNAAGTLTEKITLGSIAALAADQALNTTDDVTFGIITASGVTFSDGTSLATDPRINITASPTQLSASANNYAGLTGDINRTSSSSAVNITGIAAGTSGEAKLLVNVGSFAITLKHQSASSTAANRLIVPWAGDYVMDAAGGAALIVYDATDSRWRVV